MKNVSLTLCAYDRAGACGGPVAWAVDFTRFFAASDADVTLLILCPGGRGASSIARLCGEIGARTEVLDTNLAPFLEDQAEWILSQWKKRPSRTFIANMVLPAMFAARWIRDAGAQTIGIVHSNPESDPFYADMISVFATGDRQFRLEAMVAVSDFIANGVRSASDKSLRVQTIPCGTGVAPAKGTVNAGPLQLIYCGRLVQEQKKIRELTEAFLAASTSLGISASICGNGPERDWLEQRLAGQDRVRYLGNLPADTIHDVMADHDVIVLLSDYEGLPMSIVEGMMCGLVPVCLDEPSGAREIIDDGVNGLIVADRGDAFIGAIERLENPDTYRRLSTNAIATSTARYSHPVVFSLWRDLMRHDGTERLDVTRIPQRVNLTAARPPGTFARYPKSRPGLAARLQANASKTWTGIRQAIRPRARFRAATGQTRAE